MTALPRAYGDAVLQARFRSVPEDFLVEELPAFTPSGEGEHLLLTIEKRGMNTAFAAKHIAQWAGISEMGVGYAGLKDRHAVTRQRFSVHLPKRVAPDVAALQTDELRVLEAQWHSRKLPRGALAGNRFELTLREVAGERAAIAARLRQIQGGGLPNYFGEQRFGRDHDNVDAARRMFAGKRVGRDQRSIYLSAARSEIFNAVLASRISEGSWCEAMEGEVWMLDGTHSVFGPETLTEELLQRFHAQDIHPTAPLWGIGELRSTGRVHDLEREVAAGFADLCAGLQLAGLKQERRAARIKISELACDWLAEDVLRLTFTLPSGSYATGLLSEIGDVSQ